MDTVSAELLATLRDGVASVDPNGVLVARSPAMHELLRSLAGSAASTSPSPTGPTASTAPTLATFRLPAAAHAALLAGEAVPLQVGERHWRLQLGAAARDGEPRWLVASDVTGDVRAGAAVVEAARLRALGAAAATLVHDFNNQLNACLGLAAQVRPSLQDPLELEILHELMVGTQQGASLARTLARLLGRSAREATEVPAAHVVDEALAVASKAASQRGIRLARTAHGEVPMVRTVVTEAVQALWHTLMAIVERGPARLGVELSRCDSALAGGRPRPFARVRLVAAGLPPATRAELAALVDGSAGFLALAARSPLAPGLATAVFVQRRLGGDLTATQIGDDFVVDCLWPATP